MRSFLRLVERNDQEVGLGPFDGLKDAGFVIQHAHYFNVRLIGNRGENQFPHQPGPICNQHFDCLHAPTLQRSMSEPERRSKVQLSISRFARTSTTQVPIRLQRKVPADGN